MRELGDPAKIRPYVGPVPKPKLTPKICRAKPYVALRYTLLSGAWQTWLIHSVDRRDTPCLGEGCPHIWQGHHRGILVKHYTDAWSHLSNAAVLLEVTAGGMAPFIDDEGRIATFRAGQTVEIGRHGPQANSPGYLRVLPAETMPSCLPEGFDVLEALLANWGAETRMKPA